MTVLKQPLVDAGFSFRPTRDLHGRPVAPRGSLQPYLLPTSPLSLREPFTLGQSTPEAPHAFSAVKSNVPASPWKRGLGGISVVSYLLYNFPSARDVTAFTFGVSILGEGSFEIRKHLDGGGH